MKNPVQKIRIKNAIKHISFYKSKFSVKNRNCWHKSKFLSKIKIFVNNQIFFKNQNFCQKSKFLSKIKIFVKNQNFCQKIKIFDQKLQF